MSTILNIAHNSTVEARSPGSMGAAASTQIAVNAIYTVAVSVQVIAR